MDVQDKPHMHLEVVPDNVEWSDLLQPDWWFQIFFIFIPTWGNDPI